MKGDESFAILDKPQHATEVPQQAIEYECEYERTYTQLIGL